MGWATFWAIFSQTHLVTLAISYIGNAWWAPSTCVDPPGEAWTKPTLSVICRHCDIRQSQLWHPDGVRRHNFLKATTLYPWRDSISQPIAPVSSIAGGDVRQYH
jgi:hypothetical protein